MLRPQNTVTRQTKRLDAIWKFTAGTAGMGLTEGWRPAAQKGGARAPTALP
jgi:hypothetical protein